MSQTATDTLNPELEADFRLPVRFSVAQFDAMIEAGVFSGQPVSRFQLLRGKILTMSPPNPLHDDVIRLLSAWAFASASVAKNLYEVSVQLSMNLTTQASVVLPDLLLVTPQSYSQRRPTAADTLLLVEVSDSTLVFDLGEKMQLYAEAGVAEYWVIDIPHRSLVVHLDPTDGRYRSVQTFDENVAVAATKVSGVALEIGKLFR